MERAVAVLPGDDLAVAKDFYVRKLGFVLVWEDTADGRSGIMGLQRGTIELTIDCPMSGHGRHVCVALNVDSADDYHTTWNREVEIEHPPRNETWGARTFGVTDPFGNTLFVIGPPADGVAHADADIRKIAAIREALQAAENAADADAIAALFAEDVVAMVPDVPVQAGRMACVAFMRDALAEMSSRFDRQITYMSDEVTLLGDTACDRGTFAFTITPSAGGATTGVTGKYLWLLKRTAPEEWRITRLIVSRDDSESEEVGQEQDRE